MNSEFSPELQAELLDDFYTECDEHLGNIRAQLTRLERALAARADDPSALESLFRSLHSLKGIAAMVALRPAEQLAHSAEDFLRQLTRRECTLTETGLEILIDTSQCLELVVGAHRQRHALPDTTAVLEQLASLNAASTPPAAPAVDPFSVFAPAPPSMPVAQAVPATDPSTWLCTFFPSKELDARGINLSVVRARLSQAGEILRATPKIGSNGSMSFEFAVVFREPPVDLETWKADGLLLQQPATPPSTSSEIPASEEARPASNLFIAPSHIVRVDLSRLDDLMRITGELVIHRSRLEERLHRTIGEPGQDRSGLHEVNLALSRSLRDLRQAISRVRLVAVAEIFTRLPFVVRDLIQETGKQVQLVLEGQQTEVDKYLVERLKEPLLHLVRNAFAHGVESPEERLAAGKPAEATIVLRALAVGQSVVIQIRDDGRGIDPAVVAQKASEAGLPLPAVLDEAALLELLCTSGFSTRREADRAAGRGVGMAVVQNTVRELGGSLMLETKKGQGTQFTLRLPLTLSIIEAFIVSAGEQICAVPQSLTQEILQISAAQIRRIKQTDVIPYRDGVLPIVPLHSLFSAAPSSALELTVLVLNSDRGWVGLVVDRVSGQREVVVRPMQDPLVRVPGIFGATELGDGRPVLILDAGIAMTTATRPRFSTTSAKNESDLRSRLSS